MSDFERNRMLGRSSRAGARIKDACLRALLNARSTLPYHSRAGRYQCFGTGTRLHTDESPARWRAGYLQQSLNGGLSMRTYDLTPFYRSTVGFDRLFSTCSTRLASTAAPGYPPYNIERTGENAYRISVAVSGFARERTLHRRQGKHADDQRRENRQRERPRTSPKCSIAASPPAPSSASSSLPISCR